jgi:hypothetical protein
MSDGYMYDWYFSEEDREQEEWDDHVACYERMEWDHHKEIMKEKNLSLPLEENALSNGSSKDVRLGEKPFVQSSPVASFYYCQGEQVWDRLRTGHALTLVRDPDNPHDSRAVKLLWRNYLLGFLPKNENAVVSQLLDGGVRLLASISKLQESLAPCDRVQVEIRTDTRQEPNSQREVKKQKRRTILDKELLMEKAWDDEQLGVAMREEERQSAIEARAGAVIVPNHDFVVCCNSSTQL